VADEKSITSKIIGVAFTLLKGLSVPIIGGLIAYAVTYPIGYLSCTKYGEAKQIDTKYVWFQCYVKTDQGKWLEKTEFLASQVGMKLILKPEL
jgi:hypothetical protein